MITSADRKEGVPDHEREFCAHEEGPGLVNVGLQPVTLCLNLLRHLSLLRCVLPACMCPHMLAGVVTK